MKLISPEFLRKITTSDNIKERILWNLHQDQDSIEIVMNKKGMNFEDACDWISMNFCTGTISPEASEHEMKVMKLAAKEFIQQMKDGKLK
jgi:hypothetical protein